MPIDIKTNLPTSYDSQTDSKDDGTNTSGVLPQVALAPPVAGTSTPATSSSSAVSGITHAKTDKLVASNVAAVATSGLGVSPSELKLPTFTALDASGKLTREAKEVKASTSASVNYWTSAGNGNAQKYLEKSQMVFEAASPGSTHPSLGGSVGYTNTEAMQILQETGFKSEKVDMTMNNAANKNVMDQQMAQAKVLKSQIQGEKESAAFKLFGSLAGAALGFHMGFAGQKLRESGDSPKALESKLNNNADALLAAEKNQTKKAAETGKAADSSIKPKSNEASLFGDSTGPAATQGAEKDINKKADAHDAARKAENTSSAIEPHSGVFSKENDRARGAAYDSAGQAIAQVPGSVVDLMDKVYGGAHEADQAKIQNKQLDASITASKSVQDNTKASKDKSIKSVDDAFAAVKAHYDLEKSTADNIANK